MRVLRDLFTGAVAIWVALFVYRFVVFVARAYPWGL